MNTTTTGGTSYIYSTALITSSKFPSGRGGASSVSAEGKLIVFGGHYFISDGKFAYLDETWVYDVSKLSWQSVTCTGQIPPGRYGHSAQIIGSRMFIFGGKGDNGKILNDVYFLDLIEWIWVPVACITTGPTPRFNHASELVGRKIVIHGGWDGSHTFDDFWIFNTDSFSWIQPKVSGFAPTARFSHTMNLTPDGRLLIFGGCSLDKATGCPKYNNDLRQLDTDHMVWSRPKVDGLPPTGRQGHSSTLVGNDKLVIFGGWGKGGNQTQEAIVNPNAFSVHILDTSSMNWWCPRKMSKKPIRHMYNHSASCINSTVFIFGGYDGRQAANTVAMVTPDFGFEAEEEECLVYE